MNLQNGSAIVPTAVARNSKRLTNSQIVTGTHVQPSRTMMSALPLSHSLPNHHHAYTESMSGYKQFALAGAGNVGMFIAKALLQLKNEGSISKVSILTRSVSSSLFVDRGSM